MNGIRNRLRRKAGFSLLEVAMVLGVAGVVLGAIWWASTNARDAARANEALAEMRAISQNILSLMQGRNFSKTGDLTEDMITAQAIPTTYINASDNKKIDQPWNLTGTTIEVPSSNTARFRIVFTKVTRSGCQRLLTSGTDCQAGQVGCPVAVYTKGTSSSCQANQTNCTGTVYATGIGWQVLSPSKIKSLCDDNNYTGGTNNVTFEFSTQ